MKKHYFIKLLCCFIIFVFLLYLYGRYLNPIGLKVIEKPIYNKLLPEDYNGLKIAQFSDLHYGRTTNEETLKKTVKELNKLNADIVIFTGDLLDSKELKEETKTSIINELKNIKAKLFKFAIIGDYDENILNIYTNIMTESNFTILNNSAKLVYHNSNIPLNFVGLTTTDNINELYNTELFNITLIHQPDSATKISNSNIIFAGHSLGGQIKIPFYGGIRKIEGAKIYLNDYYELQNSQLFISNGLGTQDYSFRLFNKPSITIYRLYKD